MKFIEFCTDVTAVGVTAVVALVVAGGVASQDDGPRPVESVAAAPTLDLPAPAEASRTSVDAPQPLDLGELERSLDALLGGVAEEPSDEWRPVDRPETSRPAPPTRPVIPREADLVPAGDFMADLFEDAAELGNAPPPSRPVEVLELPSF